MMSVNLRGLRLSAIAAVGRRGEIGKAGQLIWKFSEDLQHFKRMTVHHGILMGRKTYESIGRPLPQRLNMVLSRDEGFARSVPEGVLVCSDVQTSIDAAYERGLKELFVIGGGVVYGELLGYCSRLILTKIDGEDLEADAFFPSFDVADWEEVSCISFEDKGFKIFEYVRVSR